MSRRGITQVFCFKHVQKSCTLFRKRFLQLRTHKTHFWKHLLIPDYSFCSIIILLNSPLLLYTSFYQTFQSIPEKIWTIILQGSTTVFLSYVAAVLIQSRCWKCLRTAIRQFILFLSIVMFLLDISNLLLYSALTDAETLLIITATDPNEAKEYLLSFIVNVNALFLLCLIVLFFKLSYSRITKTLKHSHLQLVVVSLFSYRLLYHSTPDYPIENSVIRLFSMLPYVYGEWRLFMTDVDVLEHPITITENNSSLPYFILVLGESTTRNHMNIYGYPLPNTPYLQERYQQNRSLFVFDDVISAACGTDSSLKTLFTFWTADSKQPWYSFTNLFDILKHAGYKTIWLSNQKPFSEYGNTATVYSKRCQTRRFTSSIPKKLSQTKYDELLLNMIDEAELSSSKIGKTFYILNVMGCHVQYRSRYPKSFSRWSHENESGKGMKQRQTKAEYDNAILYSDYFLNEVIKRFEDKCALLLFISDHGEEVYDPPGEDFLGHDGRRGSRFMVEIPFIIWVSEQYQRRYPEAIRRFKEAIHTPYMNDYLIHTILDILQIRTKEYDDEKSILSTHYNRNRKRIYAGRWSYPPQSLDR